LGYLPAHNRIYVADKDLNVSSFALSVTVVEYQTAILRGDMEGAEAILPTIPADQRNRIARFLEAQGMPLLIRWRESRSCKPVDLKELALSVSTDPDHRFDLAISLNDLETALNLVRALPEAGSQQKWKIVGDKALSAWQMDLAQESFEKANDLPALLLLYTSLSDRSGLQRLVKSALEKGQNNIAFAGLLQLGDAEGCVDLLSNTGRLPEAALFARSYAPNKVASVVKAWKAELEGMGKGKIAATLGTPDEDRELFGEIGQGSSLNTRSDGESSGVMVEKEDATEEGYEVAEDGMNGNGNGNDEDEGEKGVLEEVKEKVVEPIEAITDKVKELVVGGDGEFA
jgi:coatomer subunit beta'